MFHHIHVGAFRRHRHGNQFKSERFCDLEMTVIAGSGTEPFESLLLTPGPFAVQKTVRHGLCNGIIHQGQTGVTAHEYLFRKTAKQLCEETSCTG